MESSQNNEMELSKVVGQDGVSKFVDPQELDEIELNESSLDVEAIEQDAVEETTVVVEEVSEQSGEIGEEVVQVTTETLDEVASPLDPNAVLYVPEEHKSPFVFDTRVFLNTPEGQVLLYDAAGVVPVYYPRPENLEDWYTTDLKRFSLSHKSIIEVRKAAEEDMKFLVFSCSNFIVSGMKVATPETVYNAIVDLEKNDKYRKTNFTVVSHSLCKKLLYEADKLECKNVENVSLIVASTMVDVSLGATASSPVYEKLCVEIRNQLKTLRTKVDYSEYQRCIYTMVQGILGVAIQLMNLMGEERMTTKEECEHQLFSVDDEPTTSDIKTVTTYKQITNKIKAKKQKDKEWEERRLQREERQALAHFTNVPEFTYEVDIVPPTPSATVVKVPLSSKSGDGKKKRKGHNKLRTVV